MSPKEQRLRFLLKGAEFWRAKDLVKLGLFKHRNVVWYATKTGKLERLRTSTRVYVIPREGLIKYLLAMNEPSE